MKKTAKIISICMGIDNVLVMARSDGSASVPQQVLVIRKIV